MWWMSVAAAWTVIPAGSLQTALDASSPGDVLVLGEGTHVGPFVVSDVTLAADPNRSADVVLTGGNPTVLALFDVKLIDLVVEGAGEQAVQGSTGGSIVLDGCEVRGGASPQEGGGLKATSATVVRSVFDGNSAATGGHVHAGSFDSYGSTFRFGTSTEDGGAVFADNIQVLDSTLEDNHADGDGGAVATYSFTFADLSFDTTTFSRNTATKGGAIAASLRGAFAVTDCQFIDNSAIDRGGALDVNGMIGAIEYSSFCTNDADEGGAVSTSLPVVRNAVFHGNTANSGGALHHDGLELTMEHNLFRSNSATSVPDGAKIDTSYTLDINHNIWMDHVGTAMTWTDEIPESGSNLFWNNGIDAVPGLGGTSGDPVFTGPAGCDHPGSAALTFGPGSAALDAGDPVELDGDGTQRDIGPSGGATFVPCVPSILGYRDVDGDGLGDPTQPYQGCHFPPGYVTDTTDCDDLDPAVGAPSSFYLDADGDGHGDPVSVQIQCFAGAGAVELGDDCDDSDSSRAPSFTEIPCNGIDDDCAATPDVVDEDGDGFTCLDDCNDLDPDISPAEPDAACDGVDENCDGLDTAVDADGDGDDVCTDCDDNDPNRGPSQVEVTCNGDDDCDPTTLDDPDDDGDGWTVCAGDCADDQADVNPGASEIPCNGPDEDCDPATPDNLGDEDGDGFQAGCGDCDDTLDWVNVGAAEICNGVDDDCDGLVDEELTLVPYWPDTDGDGFGDAQATPIQRCDGAPPGMVNNDGDCDDLNPAVHEGAVDAPGNDIDEDCSGADSSLEDADGDGVSPPEDCNDADPAISPAAPEDLSPVDRNCDGFSDPRGTVRGGSCTISGEAPGILSIRAILGLLSRRPL